MKDAPIRSDVPTNVNCMWIEIPTDVKYHVYDFEVSCRHVEAGICSPLVSKPRPTVSISQSLCLRSLSVFGMLWGVAVRPGPSDERDAAPCHPARLPARGPRQAAEPGVRLLDGGHQVQRRQELHPQLHHAVVGDGEGGGWVALRRGGLSVLGEFMDIVYSQVRREVVPAQIQSYYVRDLLQYFRCITLPLCIYRNAEDRYSPTRADDTALCVAC